MPEEFPSLQAVLAQLREAMDQYPYAVAHYIPDRVLYDHAIDVAEQATAVAHLSSSDVPRAAYSNARSAMEAAQDMLFLVSDAASYDDKGCRARAAEVLENASIQRRFARADQAVGLEAQPFQSAEDVILEDAREWDTLAPGQGYILRAAFEAVQASAELQRHWSGLGRKELAAQLATILGADSGWADMHDALYGAVSAHSHPRTRSGARTVAEDGDGLDISGVPADTEVPPALATLACLSAVVALGKRRGFFGDAP